MRPYSFVFKNCRPSPFKSNSICQATLELLNQGSHLNAIKLNDKYVLVKGDDKRGEVIIEDEVSLLTVLFKYVAGNNSKVEKASISPRVRFKAYESCSEETEITHEFLNRLLYFDREDGFGLELSKDTTGHFNSFIVPNNISSTDFRNIFGLGQNLLGYLSREGFWSLANEFISLFEVHNKTNTLLGVYGQLEQYRSVIDALDLPLPYCDELEAMISLSKKSNKQDIYDRIANIRDKEKSGLIARLRKLS